jgi:hypothetical protein
VPDPDAGRARGDLEMHLTPLYSQKMERRLADWLAKDEEQARKKAISVYETTAQQRVAGAVERGEISAAAAKEAGKVNEELKRLEADRTWHTYSKRNDTRVFPAALRAVQQKQEFRYYIRPPEHITRPESDITYMAVDERVAHHDGHRRYATTVLPTAPAPSPAPAAGVDVERARAPSSRRYCVLAKATVRDGPETVVKGKTAKAAKVMRHDGKSWTLQPGEIVEVAAENSNSQGLVSLQLKPPKVTAAGAAVDPALGWSGHGVLGGADIECWVKLKTSRGKQLLEELSAEEVAFLARQEETGASDAAAAAVERVDCPKRHGLVQYQTTTEGGEVQIGCFWSVFSIEKPFCLLRQARDTHS